MPCSITWSGQAAREIDVTEDEYYQLFGRERLMEEVLRADVDATARPYPDRFIPFGVEEQSRSAE